MSRQYQHYDLVWSTTVVYFQTSTLHFFHFTPTFCLLRELGHSRFWEKYLKVIFHKNQDLLIFMSKQKVGLQ